MKYPENVSLNEKSSMIRFFDDYKFLISEDLRRGFIIHLEDIGSVQFMVRNNEKKLKFTFFEN